VKGHVHRGVIAALLACVSLATTARAGVTVEVDREPVALNESVQIVFNVDQEFEGSPDFSPLETDFELLSRNQSSNVTIVNGQYAATVRWLIEAIPRKVGVLTIPPIRFGALTSEPRTLRVEVPQPGSPGQPDSDVFIEVEATPDTPYVQGEIVLTVRIFRAVAISGARLTEPEIGGVEVVVQRTAEDRSYESRRDGRVYRVTERNYSVFPQASGTLTIGPMLFSAELGANRLLWQDPLRRGQFVRVRSAPIELAVRPIPAGFPGAVWLPARSVDLSGSWSPADPEFRVGEPATLILKLTAVGLSASQLPPVSLPLPDDLRQYPDQPSVEERWTGRNTVAQQTLRIALIPNREGRFDLPNLRLPWWNVDTDALEYAQLDDLSFVAAPGSGGPVPAAETAAATAGGPGVEAAAATARTDSGLWPWLSGLLALGWAATVALWWRRGRGTRPAAASPPRADSKAASRELRRAVRDGDPEAAARALLDWGAALWPAAPPRSLRQLAERCGSPVANGVTALERTLYAASDERWNGEELVRAVSAFRPPARDPAAPVGGLPPLYPT
jgi:hypothetical protein